MPIQHHWDSSGTLTSAHLEAPADTSSFVISTFSFSMVTMGWGGANGLAGVAYVSLSCPQLSVLPSTTSISTHLRSRS